MGVDELDLLGHRHGMGDLAGRLNSVATDERPRDGQPAEEPRRALEQGRHRGDDRSGGIWSSTSIGDDTRRQTARTQSRSVRVTSRRPRG